MKGIKIFYPNKDSTTILQIQITNYIFINDKQTNKNRRSAHYLKKYAVIIT